MWIDLNRLKNCSQVSAFDLDTGEEEILPEMNLARSSFTSIFFEKYIYIFGGKVESGDTNSCER